MGRDVPTGGNGTGYVVDCLRSAVTCLERRDYERAVRMAIRPGQDTDTTACVVGGLAGVGTDWREFRCVGERRCATKKR